MKSIISKNEEKNINFHVESVENEFDTCVKNEENMNAMHEHCNQYSKRVEITQKQIEAAGIQPLFEYFDEEMEVPLRFYSYQKLYKTFINE